MKGPALF